MNLFLQHKPSDGVSTNQRIDKTNDDGTVLVEEIEGQNEEEAVADEQKKLPSNNELWQFVAVIMDRLAVVLLMVIYVIFIFTLIPLARLTTSDPITVEK